VALIIIYYHQKPSAALLGAAILHDLHEVEIGDISYDAKAKNKLLKTLDCETERDFLLRHGFGESYALTPVEKAWLDFADMYEAYLFLRFADFVLSGELEEIFRKSKELAHQRMMGLWDMGFEFEALYLDNISD